MNKLSKLLPLLFLWAVTVSCAQNIKYKEVPEMLKTSFQKSFPDAKNAKWEKEGNNYEVEAKMNNVETSVVMDAQGNVLETEVEIKTGELPAAALEYLKTNYAGQKIKEAARMTDNKQKITYEAEVKGKDIIFDGEGNFLKIIGGEKED